MLTIEMSVGGHPRSPLSHPDLILKSSEPGGRGSLVQNPAPPDFRPTIIPNIKPGGRGGNEKDAFGNIGFSGAGFWPSTVLIRVVALCIVIVCTGKICCNGAYFYVLVRIAAL